LIARPIQLPLMAREPIDRDKPSRSRLRSVGVRFGVRRVLQECGDGHVPVIGELSVVAQPNHVGPEPDELVHVANCHLTARLAYLEDEGHQRTESGARQRSNVFEIEHETFGKFRPDQGAELAAQLGRVARIGDRTAEEFDDHDPGVFIVIQLERDVSVTAGWLGWCVRHHGTVSSISIGLSRVYQTNIKSTSHAMQDDRTPGMR
jgi:hypothetical protein